MDRELAQTKNSWLVQTDTGQNRFGTSFRTEEKKNKKGTIYRHSRAKWLTTKVSNQPKALKIQTCTSLPVQVFIYFPYLDLNSHTTKMHSRHNNMGGVVCMHMMGWGAQWCPVFPLNIHI